MAAVKSAVEATAYLSNTERVFQSQIFIMLVSGTPALIRLRAGKFVYAKPRLVYFSMAVLFGAILPGMALLLGALSFAKASRVPYSSLDNIGAPFQIDSAQHRPNSSAVGAAKEGGISLIFASRGNVLPRPGESGKRLDHRVTSLSPGR
jgi:hypothetical protein